MFKYVGRKIVRRLCVCVWLGQSFVRCLWRAVSEISSAIDDDEFKQNKIWVDGNNVNGLCTIRIAQMAAINEFDATISKSVHQYNKITWKKHIFF